MKQSAMLAALLVCFSLNFSSAATLPAGLILHLDASDPLGNGGTSLPANNSALGTWVNKASGSLNATATGSFQPTWLSSGGSNNTPIVRFDGTNDRMTAGVASDWKFLHDTTGSSVFVVWRTTDANPNALYPILSTNTFTTSVQGYQLAYDDRDAQDFSNMARVAINRGVNSSPVADIRPNDSFQAQVWGMHTSIFGYNRPGNDVELFVNGVLVGSADFNTSRPPGTGNPDFPLHIGSVAAASPTLLLKGDIAEILVFSGTLSGSDYEMVGSYLETKYLLGSVFPLLPEPVLPIPEPSSLALSCLGLLMIVRRRHKEAAA